MNKREFEYDKKESYTQQEMDKILGENQKFVAAGFKGYVSEEDHNKVLEELKPFKEEKRKSTIKGLLPKEANAEMFDDILALAKIGEDDDESAIKTKLADTIKDRNYLKLNTQPAPEFKQEKTGDKNQNNNTAPENEHIDVDRL